MFEKNISDWDITEHEDNFEEDGYSIRIGTWHNYKLSIVDCLAVLKLADVNKITGFIKLLNERNNRKQWFTKDNKQKHIDYIKKWGINPYHFAYIHGFIEMNSDGLHTNEEIYEEEYLSEEKIKDFIDSEENHNKLITAIKESESIETLYYKVMEIKEEIQKQLYENINEFIVSDEDYSKRIYLL